MTENKDRRLKNSLDLYGLYSSDIERIGVVLDDKTNRLLISEYRQSGNIIEQKRIKDELIEGNLRLVLFISLKYVKRDDRQIMDVIQAGNIGLIEGIEKVLERFDLERTTSVCTYLMFYIKKQILYMFEQTQINLIRDMKCIYFSEAVKEVDGMADIEYMENEEKREKIDIIVRAIKEAELTERQLRIIISRYGIIEDFIGREKPIRQIAKEMHISKKTVSKDLKIALQKIKEGVQKQ